jgi:hypothetical protein
VYYIYLPHSILFDNWRFGSVIFDNRRSKLTRDRVPLFKAILHHSSQVGSGATESTCHYFVQHQDQSQNNYVHQWYNRQGLHPLRSKRWFNLQGLHPLQSTQCFIHQGLHPLQSTQCFIHQGLNTLQSTQCFNHQGLHPLQSTHAAESGTGHGPFTQLCTSKWSNHTG